MKKKKKKTDGKTMAAAEHVNHSSSIIIIALKRTCKELQREAGKGKADILLLTKFRCFWNSFRQKNKTVKKIGYEGLNCVGYSGLPNGKFGVGKGGGEERRGKWVYLGVRQVWA